MSLNAVSLEHLASLAYLDEKSLLSNPSSSRFITLRYRSFTADWLLIRSQFELLFGSPDPDHGPSKTR